MCKIVDTAEERATSLPATRENNMSNVSQQPREHPVQKRLQKKVRSEPLEVPELSPEEPSLLSQIKQTCVDYVREFRKGQAGWGASFLFLAALLLCLYGIIISLKPRPEALSIDTVIAEDAGQDQLDTLLDEPTLNPAEMELPDASPMLMEQELLVQESDLLLPAADGDSDSSNLLGGETSGGKAGFFGASAQGRSFVFIVDSSGSMTGGRFERAKRELRQSIRRLEPNQQFHVVFFNSETIPMFEPNKRAGLMDATRVNLTKAGRWIEQQFPGSTTNPEGAIRLALSLKPSAIFLLSDGEFDEPQRARKAALDENHSSTVIHTIAFMSRDGEGTLRAIAGDHGGSYRFVD